MKDKLQLYIKGDLETMILWLPTHHSLETFFNITYQGWSKMPLNYPLCSPPIPSPGQLSEKW